MLAASAVQIFTAGSVASGVRAESYFFFFAAAFLAGLAAAFFAAGFAVLAFMVVRPSFAVSNRFRDNAHLGRFKHDHKRNFSVIPIEVFDT